MKLQRRPGSRIDRAWITLRQRTLMGDDGMNLGELMLKLKASRSKSRHGDSTEGSWARPRQPTDRIALLARRVTDVGWIGRGDQ